jgi:hypothetical protein
MRHATRRTPQPIRETEFPAFGAHAFNLQMAQFNVAANPTQRRYGTISHPAARERGQNEVIVARMESQRRTTSAKATPGMCAEKKIADQETLSASWSTKSMSGSFAPEIPARRHTNQAAIAMLK